MNLTYRFGKESIFLFDADAEKMQLVGAISVQQIALLDELVKVGEMTAKQVRAKLFGQDKKPVSNSHRASLSRSIRRLMAYGWIEKTRGGIKITDMGKNFASNVLPKREETNRRWAEFVAKTGGRMR